MKLDIWTYQLFILSLQRSTSLVKLLCQIHQISIPLSQLDNVVLHDLGISISWTGHTPLLLDQLLTLENEKEREGERKRERERERERERKRERERERERSCQ